MANSSFSIDYERITRPKRGRPYPFKCRICGAPAAWKETFESRDRRRFRVPWCICDACYQAAADGRHDGITIKQQRRRPRTSRRS